MFAPTVPTRQSPKQAGRHAQAAAENSLCKLERQVVALQGRVNGCRMSKQVWAIVCQALTDLLLSVSPEKQPAQGYRCRR